jgi:hypothetical protein
MIWRKWAIWRCYQSFTHEYRQTIVAMMWPMLLRIIAIPRIRSELLTAANHLSKVIRTWKSDPEHSYRRRLLTRRCAEGACLQSAYQFLLRRSSRIPCLGDCHS